MTDPLWCALFAAEYQRFCAHVMAYKDVASSLSDEERDRCARLAAEKATEGVAALERVREEREE